MRTLLVSAVALIDADGRVLLAQRPPGKSLAGLWEFPGGKVEPGETPEEGLFSFVGVEKSFVMLNIYAGFEMAAVRSSYGDLGGARGVLVPLADEVEAWLSDNPDADIEDDLAYIRKFIANLEAKGGAEAPTSPNPPNPWPRD